MDVSFDLDARPGLPEDLKLLLEKYPRESWQGHPNIEGTARFWLSRHDMFRELGNALAAALRQEREGQVDTQAFKQWFVPRLGFFLNELNGHHQIEDTYYFPTYQRAEPRLARGFEAPGRRPRDDPSRSGKRGGDCERLSGGDGKGRGGFGCGAAGA
ncbi:hemerythrin domain-containing protein [Jiella pelagia]|uniref:hemerythrin domain-containing protein n=1 Tax=Jiella pelagia TaxID=2986949 RepID=UPI002E364B56|nr:hemerythrin domain-containing protein [Jiella pelagia]